MAVSKRLQRSFKLRFAVLYPFGVLLMLFAMPSDETIRRGIGFIITGLLIRIWANGYAIKMDKLTTSGPYAFVRHPLYLGTMFIALGFVMLLNSFYIGVPLLIGLVLIYANTVKKEEGMLKDKFGNAYLDYAKNVPAMIPTFRRYRKGEKWPFSFKRLMKSKEYKLVIWVVILVIAFHLKEEFIKEKEKIDAKIILLIVLAFLLGASDLVSEALKKRFEKNNKAPQA